MIPKSTQIDTAQVSRELKLVEVGETPIAAPARTPLPLRPELRKIFDANWERDKEAYEYLGR